MQYFKDMCGCEGRAVATLRTTQARHDAVIEIGALERLHLKLKCPS